MGRFVTAYVLDLDRLHAAVGSGDKKLQREVEVRWADEIAGDRAYFESYPHPMLSLTDALHTLFAGGSFDPKYAHRYHEAYLLVCKTLSVYEDSCGPYHSDDWLEEIDRAFRTMRVKGIGFTTFEDTDMPCGLPSTSIGGYGEWDPDACMQASESTEEAIKMHDELDLDIAEWVWFGMNIAAEAASWADYGIAGFSTI